MNAVQEYLAQTGMKQADLAKRLKEKVDPRIDQALVSKMNQGVCLPSEAITVCLCASMHWPSERFLEDSGVIYRQAPEKPLRSEIYRPLVELLQKHSTPLSRALCAKILCVRDRQVREWKELATQAGYIIGADPNGMGYYLCRTRAQLMAVRAQYSSRLQSIVKTLRAIDRALAMVPGQQEMELNGTLHDDD